MGLEEIIIDELEIDLPEDFSEKDVEKIDFRAKDAFRAKEFYQAMIKRAKAGILYVEIDLYYQAANSFDRAACAAEKLQNKTQACLYELAGIYYSEIEDWENTAFAYAKAAECYIKDRNDPRKTRELLIRAECFFKVAGKNHHRIRQYRNAKKLLARLT